MKTLTITVPDDLPGSLEMSDEQFQQEARLLLAVKLYELGRISAGVAAQLAGVERVSFLTLLSRYSVPAINLQGEEIKYEIKEARKLATG
ncbi:MAG: hypothetical protein KatS3mg022_3451 [Armatimonadota bacterium]|nr:MAG: hypothetical protein KatS3mg022_3451 [Armatimonadota bacterium]